MKPHPQAPEQQPIPWHTRAGRFYRRNYELFFLSFPAIIFIFVMAYVPMFGIVIAFKNFHYELGFWGSPWIGFKNFEFLFKSDTAYRITRNTVLYNLGYMFLTTTVALSFAVMLNEIRKRWFKLYQTSLFLPYFLSWVVVGYIAQAFLDHQSGYLNEFLMRFGGEPIDWFFRSDPWPYILNVAHLWKSVGFATLVYYAGILGIDSEYYEAAKIDGASRMQMVWRITLPQLTPLIIILTILGIGSMFRGDFGLHYFIPNNSGMTLPTTDIIDTYVYRALSSLGDVGMAAAVGLYQSVVGLVLVLIANYTVRKISEENSLW